MTFSEERTQAVARGDLVLNAAECAQCGQVVWSATVHDFRTCECGQLSVDGGLHYLKRNFDGPYTELSIYLDADGRGRRAQDGH